MGLLDGFEKLINEHGSAVILKERIALANDKYSALEHKLSECASAKMELESENEALRLNLEKAKIEIQNLKKLSEQSHGQRLEEIREKLLLLLSAQTDITSQQIGRSASINPQLATFHLTDMQDKGLVNASYSFGGDTEWSIAQDGLGYLVRHGLLA